LSSHPSRTRFIFPTWAIKAATASANTSPPSEPLGRTSLSRNAPELGDSEGARRRIDAVRGDNVLVRVKRCGNGLDTFEGIEWLMDGAKLVGGSYLVKWSSGA
jgi:hypothetical protein